MAGAESFTVGNCGKVCRHGMAFPSRPLSSPAPAAPSPPSRGSRSAYRRCP